MSERDLFGMDKDLIASSLEGNEDAFRQLFEKYWDDLYKIAYRRLSSTEDVKDILQEVFISLWNNRDKIKVEDNLGGYLYTSLRNKIFNHYEKHKVRLKALMHQSFNPVESEDLICSTLYTKELQAVIAMQVVAMPPQMRQIYLLSKEEQLSIAEITALLTLAPQTVKNQLHRALKRIRLSLRDSDPALLLLFILTTRHLR